MNVQYVVIYNLIISIYFKGNLLSVRSQEDQYHHYCNACKWTSKDLEIPLNRTNEESWPEPINPLNEELGRVMDLMKGLNSIIKLI